MEPGVRDLLDGGHVQPDRFSCGAQSVVMASACLAPGLAHRLSNPATLQREVLDVHRDLVTPTGRTGHQLPWPRRLGTPPWAVARALRRASGAPYRVRWALAPFRAGLHERVLEATRSGWPVPLYVGNAWMPRHVVLAAPSPGDDGRLLVHDPATGRLAAVTAARWTSSTLDTTSWPVPWAAVVPTLRG